MSYCDDANSERALNVWLGVAYSLDEPDIENWEQLFSMDITDERLFDQHQRDGWFSNAKDRAERTLERYVGLLEPNTVQELQHIAGTDYWLLQIDSEVLQSNPDRLMPAIQEAKQLWAEAILALHRWSWIEHSRLQKLGTQVAFPCVYLEIPTSDHQSG